MTLFRRSSPRTTRPSIPIGSRMLRPPSRYGVSTPSHSPTCRRPRRAFRRSARPTSSTALRIGGQSRGTTSFDSASAKDPTPCSKGARRRPGSPHRNLRRQRPINSDGLLDRYLTFACVGARDPIPTDLHPTATPADAAVVHQYFRDLDAGRFAEAAGHFSDDVLYSHPPYQHTGLDDPNRIEFRGRRRCTPLSTNGAPQASTTRC